MNEDLESLMAKAQESLSAARLLLDRGQDIRNVGDYGVGTEISSEQAVEVISRAEEFIRAGQACLRAEG